VSAEAAEALAAFERDWPVTVRLPVVWGEMDAFGHVNNVVYFRYFESARIACFERVGYTSIMSNDGIGPILAHTECRFRLPLEYPDTVTAATRVAELSQQGFLMKYAVFSHARGRLAAEGTGRIVSLDYRSGTKTDLSSDLAERLSALR
jgi:acyl-CoA thioester hydrolase